MDAGEDDGEAPAAGRPAPLLEVLPQERVQQRTAEQIVDPVPVVPLLHDAAPQMVEQLVDFLTLLDLDRLSTPRCSHCPWCAADGGTAGGSAYDRVSYRCHQAACRAAR